MSTFQVVIALDGSAQSEYAFNWYIEHFHKPGHYVTLLHCGEADRKVVGGADEAFMSYEVYLSSVQLAQEGARKIRDKYEALLKAKKVDGTVVLSEEGKAGQTIIQKADQLKANLIVTGTRGQGTVRRTILGSVSDYLMHHAKCPVMICRKPDIEYVYYKK